MKSAKRDDSVHTPILPDDCPACHQEFDFVSRRVVQQSDAKMLIHGQCGHCLGQLLVFQLGKDHNVLSAIALLTDLTYDDVRAYWASERVSQDDVIEMHSLLKESDAFLKEISIKG